MKNSVKEFRGMSMSEDSTGLMVVLEGLIRGLEGSLGKDRAREIAYRAGYDAGEQLGRKLGACKPEEALRRLANNLPPIYKLKVVDVNKKSGALEAAVQFEACAVRNMLKCRELSYPSIACRFSAGYIEGALNAMTGMKAKNLIYESSISSACIGTLSLQSEEAK